MPWNTTENWRRSSIQLSVAGRLISVRYLIVHHYHRRSLSVTVCRGRKRDLMCLSMTLSLNGSFSLLWKQFHSSIFVVVDFVVPYFCGEGLCCFSHASHARGAEVSNGAVCIARVLVISATGCSKRQGSRHTDVTIGQHCLEVSLGHGHDAKATGSSANKIAASYAQEE